MHLPFSLQLLTEVTVLIVLLVVIAFLLGSRPVHKRLKPNQMDAMSGIDFERLLRQTLKKTGWQLSMTSRTGDFGADLIGISPWGVSYAIQAKRWKAKIGVRAIQEAYAAQAHYQTHRALVITNSWLTKPARQLAQELSVEVWERPRLEREFEKAYDSNKSNKRTSQTQNDLHH
ncbi:hypothetical protein AN477_16320 [Alicyclobacillus ferrooxydans]|uniref:Restriction endonuclease type IV Mrr domain-containing protein n=1 Tax=Alicyclobacillus ferrooxydans TaxID=471514 RepID=A0A0N8PNX1_9BACL|nr:hypothetical protein AN477_16320 [Alicyclobacillus ferrooxydans]